MLHRDPDPRDDLSRAEARLASLRPRPADLDRDRLLFEAGRASAQARLASTLRLASGSATILAAVALGLGGLLASERGRRLDLEAALARLAPEIPRAADPTPERAPVLVEAPPPLSPVSYLALTRLALEAPALPPTRSEPDPSPPPRALEPPPPTLQVRGGPALLDL